MRRKSARKKIDLSGTEEELRRDREWLSSLREGSARQGARIPAAREAQGRDGGALDGEVTDMGEVRGNQVQVPAPGIRTSVRRRGMEAFGQGIAAGGGFVLGQILFRRRRPAVQDASE